jgi:hypothetical protein
LAETLKILGQVAPAATTETDLYTVPSATAAAVSTLTICNRSATPGTYRVALRPAADASTADKHWVVYGASIDGSDSTFFTLGWTLAAGDKIIVFTSSANMSATVTGSELA